jgi:hypothetical protein
VKSGAHGGRWRALFAALKVTCESVAEFDGLHEEARNLRRLLDQEGDRYEPIGWRLVSPGVWQLIDVGARA